MNTIDIVIIVFILLGAFIGFKRGVISSAVSLVGTVFVVLLAYYLRTPLSAILYKNLPFMDFGGIFEGISSLNILLYEAIAFLISLIVLSIILKVILVITKLVDKLIKMTVVLALPSKILGALFGGVQYFLYIFALLFVLSLVPKTNVYVIESKVGNAILKNTPVISKITSDLYNSIDGVYLACVDSKDHDKSDYESLEALLKNGILDVKSAKFLLDKGKLTIKDADTLLEKYGDDEND